MLLRNQLYFVIIGSEALIEMIQLFFRLLQVELVPSQIGIDALVQRPKQVSVDHGSNRRLVRVVGVNADARSSWRDVSDYSCHGRRCRLYDFDRWWRRRRLRYDHFRRRRDFRRLGFYVFHWLYCFASFVFQTRRRCCQFSTRRCRYIRL